MLHTLPNASSFRLSLPTTCCILCLFFCFLHTSNGQTASYRIENIDLQIEPDFKTKKVLLSATIEIKNSGLESEFSFGLNDRYDSVIVTAGRSPASFTRADGEITVTLNQPSENVKILKALASLMTIPTCTCR